MSREHFSPPCMALLIISCLVIMIVEALTILLEASQIPSGMIHWSVGRETTKSGRFLQNDRLDCKTLDMWQSSEAQSAITANSSTAPTSLCDTL